MNKIIFLFSVLFPLCLCGSTGCEKHASEMGANPDRQFDIATDKVRYAPGESVRFTCSAHPGSGLTVRYRHLSTLVEQHPLTAPEWSWTPPSEDFRGYLVEVVSMQGATERVVASTAVDVSSDWTRFPRYGFLSSYGSMSLSEVRQVIENLNRYHINGLQFYDWLAAHHRPFAGSVEHPAAEWPDLMNRPTYRLTTDNYLFEARARGMKTLFYDLCYGALENAGEEGVDATWYLFTDPSHTNRDKHQLPSSFRSSIYLVNPARAEWTDYLADNIRDLYQVYGFDGFHIDQLGARSALYDYNGSGVDLPSGFQTFLERFGAKFPDKVHVFNAVGGYGQEQIAASRAVSFLYNEVWQEQSEYSHLKEIIDRNNAFSEGKLNTVLAAYVNYDLSSTPGGSFNTPGVLMTDAVIFALGGAHLELGEHMLCNEYFPNKNLSMDADLQRELVSYYDFAVAYENLLRDGGSFNTVDLQAVGGGAPVQAWPPVKGSVSVLGRRVADRQVIHLHNFVNAYHLSWRDLAGDQTEPNLLTDLELEITVEGTVTRVWCASPDSCGEMYRETGFRQEGNKIRVTLPWLKYWSMLVIEY